jgi:hypothetical protein
MFGRAIARSTASASETYQPRLYWAAASPGERTAPTIRSRERARRYLFRRDPVIYVGDMIVGQ